MLLPVVAAFALAACTNTETTTADVSDANTAWQTDVQSTSMPASMTTPTYQQPTYSQPTYSQPTYTAPQPQPVYSQPATSYGNAETVGNCQVVRDTNNTPIYSQMQKGCYTDSTYTVGKSDTVYLISFLTGTSVSQIASLNNLSQPYQLRVGQSLRVR